MGKLVHEKPTPTSVVVHVQAVESFAGYVVHMGPVLQGTLRVGDLVESQVDYDRRQQIAPNHTMTHVLNYALRKVIYVSITLSHTLSLYIYIYACAYKLGFARVTLDRQIRLKKMCQY
jgi:Ser-tRNA(Ala) deacylase AlaX